MAADDPDPMGITGELEMMVERLRNLSIKKATDASPKNEAKQLEELAATAERLGEALATHERHQAEERRLTMWLDAMHARNAPLFEAINENMTITNELLVSSLARLDAIESSVIARGRGAFEADPEVIAEGEFLALQLVGDLGTEGRSPLFINAPPVVIPSSIDVLADALEDAVEQASFTGVSSDEKE